MLISSLVDRTYLYEDHFQTVINNSDKHGRSSKHEAAEVERCFESMNGSEKTSSEAYSGCSSIEYESDRLRLVAFLSPVHGFEPELLYI